MAKSTMKLSDILRGCTPEGIQTVGHMQVIPLVSDVIDNSFASPKSLRVSTQGYGTLVFNNQADSMVIIPSNAAYLTKEAAQDHAMMHAGLVKGHKVRSYNTAACIQQSQPGFIKEGDHEIRVLPVPLRQAAFKVRSGREYGKLWPSISAFNKAAGLEARGHLEFFIKHFAKELDEFQAEFEPVPNQVGAIILVGGAIVGVERAPNHAYWLDMWRPLIRDCYGSLAIIEARKNKEPVVPPTRVALRKAGSLDDLAAALREAKTEEYKRVSQLVNAVCDREVGVSLSESESDVSLQDLDSKQFVGQVVVRGEKIVYVSLVTTEVWRNNKEWYEASKFSM